MNFPQGGREPPMLDDSERPTPPPLKSEKSKSFGLKISIFIGIFGLVSISGLVWFALNQGDLIGERQDLPLVKAENSPIRVKPDNPGGLEVPNRDRLILKNLETANPSKLGVPEKLIPRAESPIFTNNKEPSLAAPDNEKISKDKEVEQKQEKIKTSKLKRKSSELKKSEGYNKGQDEKGQKNKPLTIETKQEVISKAATHRVQLASLAKQKAADKFWKQMKKKHPTLFGEMLGRVFKIKLKSKGTFYRVQGDAISRNTAEKICKIMKTKKQACLVVKN